MPHPTVLPLRALLATLLAGRPALPGPAGAGLDRAARLRLSGAERAAEAAIDALRQRLGRSTDTVEVVDYGAGTRGGERPPVRRVAEVYRRAATGPAWGRFLFGLVRGMRPARVLELGTNLGVGAAHLAAGLALNEAGGGPAGRLVTLEGAPALAALAESHLAGLGHGGRVEVVVGPFAETLPTVAASGPFDLVFVDGHHQAEAALGYLRTLAPALAPGALVVLDDVEPGRPVRRAWRALREADPERPSAYVLKYGLWMPSVADGGTPEGAPAPDARVEAPAPDA